MKLSKLISRATLLTLAITLISSIIIRAQVRSFGDVTEEDFSAYSSEYDSSASAVILFEFGDFYFDNDFNCFTEIHKRLKILNDEGLDYGDIDIIYRKDFDQAIYDIEAVTYNLSEDGTIQTSKLGRREVFDETIRDDIKRKKFTMPDLKAGSIIEVSYRKKVGNPFLMPDWKFHDYIPVMWSELKMKIPAELYYRMIFKGKEALDINEQDVAKTASGAYRLFRFARKNLPAVEDLPFLYNREDHISELRNQLIKTQIGGRLFTQNFFEDWEAIAKDLNDRDDFGKQKVNRDIKRKVEELVSEDMSDIDRMKVIYDYLVSHMHWDGFYRVVTKQGIRDTFKDKKGNTADINLLLVEMLREAGLMASPALISTSGNGTILMDFPLINQFNSVVAIVEIGQNAVTLDASSGKRSYRVQHPKFMNRNAFVIREDDSHGWLQTTQIENTSERISLDYSLSDSSFYRLKLLGYASGVYAQEYRNEVDSTDAVTFWKKKVKRWDDFEVDSAIFENLDDIEEDIKFSAEFRIDKKENMETESELIYHNPFIGLSKFENPFLKEKRDFRVEIPFPFKDEVVLNLKIPKGYVIEDFPESFSMQLRDRLGHFQFVVGRYEDKLTVYSNLTLNTYYVPKEYYPELRLMFMKYEELHNSVLVLKKLKE